MVEHYLGERYSLSLEMWSVERHNWLACFDSFHSKFFIVEEIWAYKLFFLDSRPYYNTWAMHKWLATFSRTFSTLNSHILLLNWTIQTKNASSKKIIFERYSEYPSGWFWQCWANWSRLILPLFWRPRNFVVCMGTWISTSIKYDARLL